MNDREETIFDAARKLTDPAGRKAFLDAACAIDPQMRRHIEELLAVQSDADGFFEEDAAGARLSPGAAAPAGSKALDSPDAPTLISPAAAPESRAPMEGPGTVIGRYKLLEQIGEGGFGVVYVAEQREPVKRRVALKIIKLGMDTKQVVARFEAERQALALMDHTNIAKVFDAGATDTGRPYFVMELVRGIKITDYCDQNHLPTIERLKLFIQVCHAIQHAHQKGIIHRDIKPSNILVTLHDGVPVPKVIDFGIAKATQQELTEKTVYTQLQQFIGTPAYMSPEQAEMSGLDIDTRSDIYSLGVLLYELLTGQPPFDPKELLKAGLDEMRRRLREEEPVKPSTRLTQELVQLTSPVPQSSTLTSQPEARASSRRLLQKRKELINAIRGDLDWIVMKTLEKDRTRRYETANGLASDIERHLHSEPVLAAAPSQFYKFKKFARRNKIMFVATFLIGTILLVSAIVSTVLLLIVGDQAKKAKTAAEISTAVSDFLQKDLLAQASPESQPDRDLKVRTVLDRAAQKIEGRFTKQPLVEAAIRSTITWTYFSLGEARTAEPHARRVVELYRSQLGPEHRITLQSMNNLAEVYRAKGQLVEAAMLQDQTLDIQKRVLGPEHPNTLSAMSSLAFLYDRQGKFGQAESVFREALQLLRRQKSPDARTLATVLAGLGHSLMAQQKPADAEPFLHECLELRQKAAPDDWRTFNARSLLGGALSGQKRFEAAESVLLEGYEGFKQREQRIPASDRVFMREAAERLVQLYEAWGKPVHAAEWMKKLEAFDQAEAGKKSVQERKEENK